MELKQLRSFAAVVELESFSKAAERLYLSQPTVSTHVRQLEEEAGMPLIMRSTRSIQPTPRGRELYDCARGMLDMHDGLMHRWNTEDSHVIRLGASTIPSAYILPELLPLWREIHPETRFSVHQSDSRGVLESVLAGSCELGLVGMGEPVDGVELIPFFRDRMVLIAPATEEYRALGDRFPLKRLMTDPVILREQGSGSRKWAEEYFSRMGLRQEDMNVAARLNDQESVKQLVAAGLGVSVVSELSARELCRAGRLFVFSLPGETPCRNLYMVRKKNSSAGAELCELMEFLKSLYRDR